MLSRLVIAILSRSKRLFISWLKSPSAVILEPPQNKVCHFFPLFRLLFAMKWWDWMQWSLFSECWVLSQLFHSPFTFIRTSLVAQTVNCLPTMRETRVQSLSREDPLEKEMAPHSSIFAWKIPWTEDSGRLQSKGSQRVRHDWVTSLSLSSRGSLVPLHFLP